MATFYKRGGKSKRGGIWYIQYHDEHGCRRTVRGCSDRVATEQIARKLEADAALRKAGVLNPAAERITTASKEPILTHVASFARTLHNRPCPPKNTGTIIYWITRTLELGGVTTLAELGPDRVLEALGRLRESGLGLKTINEHLASVKQFAKWAERSGMLAHNPIVHLQKSNAALDVRRGRRALSDDELRTLIETTARQPKRQGMSGPERSLIYWTAAASGLRKSELGSLTTESFRMDENPAVVVVEACHSKHGRQDIQPLPSEIVEALREHLATLPNGAPVFHVPPRNRTFQAIRADLEAAGILFETSQGRADFHALRHSYITRLARSGMDIKAAQTLARHTDVRLTIGRYSHIALAGQAEALARVPALAPRPVSPEEKPLAHTLGESPVQSDVGTSVGSQATQTGIKSPLLSSAGEEQGNDNSNKLSRFGNKSQPLARQGVKLDKVGDNGFEPMASWL